MFSGATTLPAPGYGLWDEVWRGVVRPGEVSWEDAVKRVRAAMARQEFQGRSDARAHFFARMLVIAVFAGAVGGTQALAQGQGGPMPPMPVEAVAVEGRPLQRTIEAVGSLRSGESVMIRPEVAGRIAVIAFEEGQPVEAGAVLVRLDDTAEQARLASARAQLALSQANHRRAQELAKRNNVSQAALEEAFSRMQVDQAAVAVAQAALDKTLIRAPFTGVVGLRQVSVGAYVQAGHDIVNLESLHPLKVDFKVPELFATKLKKGQTVNIRVDAVPGRTFEGTVTAVDPQVDVAGRAIVLRASVSNPERLLRPGMFARVTLVLETKPSAITVPEQALVPRGKQQMVVKVVDGKAEYVPVEIGQREAGRVEITKGVGAGDVVVTAGQLKLRPGQPVQVLPSKDPAEQGGEQGTPVAGSAAED